jgi:glycosyltransferase involved in cell wall biosynthesis
VSGAAEVSKVGAAARGVRHGDSVAASASPAVSVIVPAYNAARFIADALESVFAQTFGDFEIVVVNDGSPDTPALERALAPCRDRLTYVAQENGGPSRARNAAARAARGRYLALLDADDVWEPDYLASQVAALEADPSADAVYANGVIFGDGADAGREMMDAFPSGDGEVTFERVLTGECTVLICAVVRRAAFERVGGFDDDLRAAEDFDLWLRVLKSGGRILCNRRRLMRYRRSAGSNSSSQERMYAGALAVFEKTAARDDLSAGERRAVERERARYRAMLRRAEGKRALAHGDTTAARGALAEANSYFGSAKLRAAVLALRVAPWLLRGAYRALARRGDAREARA